jgi:hypothetical protein
MTKQPIQSTETTLAIAATRPSFVALGTKGSENVSVEDLTIPRIGIVQDLSPERKKSEPNYIPGAEEGMLFNSVTRKLYTDPLVVIPVYYRREFFLWRPRKQGGGFRGVFQTRASAEAAQASEEEQTEIMETGQQFVLCTSDNGQTWEEAVVSMSSSNFGVSRQWNSDLKLRNCDRFATLYSLTAVQKAGPKGSYYKFHVQFLGWVKEEWYKAAEKVYEAVKAGVRDIARGEYTDTEDGPVNGTKEDMGF